MSTENKAPLRVARRGFLLGGVGLAGLGLAGAHWFNVFATGDDKGVLSAPDAYQRAALDQITLIDIRRPQEWAQTGIPEGGVPIDMRVADFVQRLRAQVQGNLDAPIALICARGVRSRRMAAQLQKAGFTQIVDVSEGMLGSGAGPGWLKRGLPVALP